MQFSRGPKAVDTKWYLGVLCLKCKSPILFALDRSEGEGKLAAPGKLFLTCSQTECRAQADYSGARISRYQSQAKGDAAKGDAKVQR
jgi:hypothetical protein